MNEDCLDKTSTEEQMKIILSWFENWTTQQRHAFVDILVTKVVPLKVSSLYDAIELLHIQENSPDMFHCQLRMFNKWFLHWRDEEKNGFVDALEEKDYQVVQYFYEKVAQTAQQP